MNFSKKYKKVQVIGRGTYGIIYKIMDRTTRNTFVLKEIELSNLCPINKKKSMNEVLILKSLDHPHILKYIESFCANGEALFPETTPASVELGF